MDKIAFLDRDGVINKRAPLHCYITKWDDFVLLDGVIEAIRLLNNSGYKVVVISNQRCIALGQATLDEIKNLHSQLNKELMKNGAHIDAFYICPHKDEDNCNCRKPKIGLFLQTEKEFDVDKEKSFMIGDSETDILAGNNYGIDSYLIDENNNLLDTVRRLLCKC